MSMIIDGTSGVTFPNSTVQASAGSVIQVVSASSSTEVSTTSTSPVATGFSVSITPKFSTSKILVIMTAPVGIIGISNLVRVGLYRGTTNLGASTGLFGRFQAAGVANADFFCSAHFLDSPATTSSTTYNVYYNVNGGTGYFCSNNATATITVMEIA